MNAIYIIYDFDCVNCKTRDIIFPKNMALNKGTCMKTFLQNLRTIVAVSIALSLVTACSNVLSDTTEKFKSTTPVEDGGRRVASWVAKASGKRISSATYTYNVSGQLTEIRKNNYNTNTNEVQSTMTTKIYYDNEGRISRTSESGTAYVAYGDRTFLYNEQGKVSKQVMTLNDPPVSFEFDYTYQDGKLSLITSVQGDQRFDWNKDMISRMSLSVCDYRYAYDNTGKCIGMNVSNPHVRNEYTYNERNELVRNKFYDEVSLFYTQDFTWEPGIGNYDISDVVFSLTYKLGFFNRFGLP